jgi:O-acetyl-ADP-ribose deacetylase (regulator of RNase III)
LGGCETGEAKITRAYRLPASYIIHTVGPVYSGLREDANLLESCYCESLLLAEDRGIKSISFPAISTGVFGYPIEDAAKIALKTALNTLRKTRKIRLIRFVLHDSNTLRVHENVLKSLVSSA